jgi:hypothetical protein
MVALSRREVRPGRSGREIAAAQPASGSVWFGATVASCTPCHYGWAYASVDNVEG